MTNPRVSVIVPAYNVEKYIVQCIKSIQGQSYDNVELIVVDNESTDGTYDILQMLQQRFPFRLEVAKNIHPFCWDEGKDLGMSLMTGEWFTVMGSDDYIDADYISKVMTVLENDTGVLALQSPMKGMRNNLEVGMLQHNYASIEEFKQQALTRSPVSTPSVFYHRSLYEDGLATGKPELYSGAADYNLYCELADKGIFIKPVQTWLGYYYRWHDEQATWAMHRQPTKYDKLIQAHWRKQWR